MNPDHLTSLKQAAELIKEGKTKPARGFIIEVLRADPDNVQAWYMLSFAVPKVDRQIYALQQTIRLDPDHQKAISRLGKLGGEFPGTTEDQEIDKPFSKTKDDQPAKLTQEKDAASEDDLLSQRLFGEQKTEKEPQTQDESQQAPKSPVLYHEIAEQAESETKEHPDEYSELRDEIESPPKIVGIPQNLFYGIAGILVITLIAIIGFSPQLIDLIEGAATPLPQPTNTTIPPTPTIEPTPTLNVEEMFSTEDLLAPSESSIAQMVSIQSGIQILLNNAPSANPTVFSVDETNLQTLILDFGKFEGYRETVQKNQKIFEVLGLAERGDDFTSFYQNIWVDPNGTLFLPDKDIIALVGFELSDYQKFSFSQAYVQAIRNQQYSFEDMGVYPPCIELFEGCEISLAVVKGEAAFTAWQWVLESYEEQEANAIIQTSKKLSVSPIFSPPLVMEAVRFFPYDQGFAFVDAVFQEGGWEAVKNIYTNPPTTTEQILHPEKYFSGEIASEIDATDLSTILTAEWQPVFQDSLGEWNTFLVLTAGTNPFTRIDSSSAQLATAGWNGDYTQIFSTLTGEHLVIGHWTFDSETDAEEFFTTFGLYNSQRFVGDLIEINRFPCNRDSNQISCLIIKEDNVIWVLAPDIQVTETILENYQFLLSE